MDAAHARISRVRAVLGAAADRLERATKRYGEQPIASPEAVEEAVSDPNALIALKGALAYLNPRSEDDPKNLLSVWAAGARMVDVVGFLRHLSETHHLPLFMEAGIKLHRPSQGSSALDEKTAPSETFSAADVPATATSAADAKEAHYPADNNAKLKSVDFAKEAIETLRNAAFPVYAVPPSEWAGDVMVGGGWGSTEHPLDIVLRYDDDLMVERPERRINLTSTGIEGLGHRSPQDRFLLWEHSYSTNLINFVSNISKERLPERPIPGSERFNAEMVDGKLVPRTVHLHSAGPRRLIDAVPFTDGYQMERVAFEDRPELRLYRVQMPEVEVLMLAWGWDDEFLREFMSSARPIKGDEKLFGEIERAEYAAWQKIRQRKEQQPDG